MFGQMCTPGHGLIKISIFLLLHQGRSYRELVFSCLSIRLSARPSTRFPDCPQQVRGAGANSGTNASGDAAGTDTKMSSVSLLLWAWDSRANLDPARKSITS